MAKRANPQLVDTTLAVTQLAKTTLANTTLARTNLATVSQASRGRSHKADKLEIQRIQKESSGWASLIPSDLE